MRKEVSVFTDSLTGEFPIGSFPNGSLILFHDGLLHILKNFTLLKGVTEYEQHVRITPVPAVPSNAQIISIKTSDDGSSNPTIQRCYLRDSFGIGYVHHALPEVSKCKKITITFTKHGSAKILDAKFVPELIHPGCMLSVLTSDNCLRLYSLIADQLEPLSEADFSSLIAANNNGKENTFGFYTTIVSYDLVTCSPELCFLVIDSEGQLYSVTVTDDFVLMKSVLNTPPGLPCDPSILYEIKNPFSQVFSSFVTVSNVTEGNLSHFILIPYDDGFEIILQERITVPYLPSHVYLTSSTESSYFIGTPNQLYMIDIHPWIDYFGNLMSGKSEKSVAGDSKLHIVAASMETLPKTTNQSTYGQTVAVRCSTEDSELIMLVSRFYVPHLVISFIRNNIVTEIRPTEQHTSHKDSYPDWKQTSIDPILSQMKVLPKITGKTDECSKKLLKEFEQWLSTLSANLGTMRTAADVAMKRLSEFVPLAKRLTEDRDILSKRLATAGSDLMHFHEELNKRRQKMDILTNRLDSLSKRANEQRPLTDQEKSMLKTLQEYRKQAITLCDGAAVLSISMAEEKRVTYGPAKSFQPSLSSYSASAEKYKNELDFIAKRLDKLQKMMENAK